MKNPIFILLALLLINCTSDDAKPKIDNPELLGKWRVIEQLADPGDGSGTFQPISSNRTVEFFSNGTVTASGTLCFMGTENNSGSGTFVLDSESGLNEGEITPNDCNPDFYRISFEIESSNLILWYPCIEGCGEKFVKIL